MKKFAKNEFFKIFVAFLMAFFSKINFLKTFLIQPPIFMIAAYLI